MYKKLVVLFLILFLVTNAFAITELNIVTKEIILDRESTLTNINEITSSTSNQKLYDSKTQELTIKSPTGLTTYANIKLLTPLHNKVGLGYQKVAEFEVDSKVNYTDFLKQMYFFDTRNNNVGIRRSFDLKKEVITPTPKPVYECDDYDEINIMCNSYRETGTVIVDIVSYELLTEKDFGIEKQKISVWVQIDKSEKIEWIPELYDIAINEWADWTADLNTDLEAYYSFDETSGTTIADIGRAHV